MAVRALLLLIIVCYISYHGKAEEGIGKLSMVERLEIKKQLKLLNKPALKTIKTQNGIVYDCIDFFKQPAFDHPLLKNHSYHYQMKPSSRPKMNGKEPSSFRKLPLEIGLKDKGCPIGTVPIRRITKRDLIRSKLFTNEYGSRFSSLTLDKPGLHHAVLRTKPDPNKKFNGGGVVMSAYQPHVTGSQYSSSQMTIRNGPDSIQVGWTVNPTLYGDDKTHLFTFLQYGATSCFNTQCPGFVIVNAEIPLDAILQPISQRGGPIYELTLFVYRDQANGNWWLEFGRNNTQIGFWPSRIFTGLTDLATYIEWGGEAYGPPGQPCPPMGNGYFPEGNDNYDTYCEHITTINENHDPVDAVNTEGFTDNESLCKVDDWGIRGKYGHVFVFGGPGG